MPIELITGKKDRQEFLSREYKRLRAATKGMANRPTKHQCHAIAWGFLKLWIKDQERNIKEQNENVVRIRIPFTKMTNVSTCVVSIYKDNMVDVTFE